jgi:hypothetical protein
MYLLFSYSYLTRKSVVVDEKGFDNLYNRGHEPLRRPAPPTPSGDKTSWYKTQGRVAKVLGITPQTLNAIIGGKRPILNASLEGALEPHQACWYLKPPHA